MPLSSLSERKELIEKIDVANAECFMPKDKAMILEKVKSHHGSYEAFDKKLKLHLLLEPLSYKVDIEQHLARSHNTEWDFTEVKRWIQGDKRALCVLGEAGTGKSTVSAAMVRALQSKPGLSIAYHYLKYSDQRRLDVVRIIKSLAAQLANR